MDNLYAFVLAVKELPAKIKHFEDVIGKIIKQTVECAVFIREYTGNGFVGKNYTGIVKSTGLSSLLTQPEPCYSRFLALRRRLQIFQTP
jgi:hypothetical protein